MEPPTQSLSALDAGSYWRLHALQSFVERVRLAPLTHATDCDGPAAPAGTPPDFAWRPQARRLGLLEDAAVQRALESMTAETNALEALSDQERNGTRVRAWWAVRAGARRLQTRA